MKVVLIAKTDVDLFPANGSSRHVMPGKAEGTAFEKKLKDSDAYYGASGEQFIEYLGRLEFDSLDLPDHVPAETGGFIRTLIDNGPTELLQHVSASLYIEEGDDGVGYVATMNLADWRTVAVYWSELESDDETSKTLAKASYDILAREYPNVFADISFE
jgi:hypothetical protein